MRFQWRGMGGLDPTVISTLEDYDLRPLTVVLSFDPYPPALLEEVREAVLGNRVVWVELEAEGVVWAGTWAVIQFAIAPVESLNVALGAQGAIPIGKAAGISAPDAGASAP